MSQTIFASTPEQAADAVAAALAEGIAPEAIGEAMSLAANQLVLRDTGRPKPTSAQQAGRQRPRRLHRRPRLRLGQRLAQHGPLPTPRNAVACLILGAYQCAFDRADRGGDFLNWEPYPRAEAREKVADRRRRRLLAGAEAAIRNKDQATACAGPALRRAGPSGTAGLRPAAELRRQRGRRAARREVLPHRVGGVRRDAAGLPLAAAGRPGARHRQRVRPAGAGLRRGVQATSCLDETSVSRDALAERVSLALR